MTFYLGVVDPAADGTWGVIFPDLPGCYSAGDDMDDLFASSIEAIRMWAEEARSRGGIPAARDNATLLADPEVKAMVEAAGPTGPDPGPASHRWRSQRACHHLARRPFARYDRPGRQAARPHALELPGERGA